MSEFLASLKKEPLYWRNFDRSTKVLKETKSNGYPWVELVNGDGTRAEVMLAPMKIGGLNIGMDGDLGGAGYQGATITRASAKMKVIVSPCGTGMGGVESERQKKYLPGLVDEARACALWLADMDRWMLELAATSNLKCTESKKKLALNKVHKDLPAEYASLSRADVETKFNNDSEFRKKMWSKFEDSFVLEKEKPEIPRYDESMTMTKTLDDGTEVENVKSMFLSDNVWKHKPKVDRAAAKVAMNEAALISSCPENFLKILEKMAPYFTYNPIAFFDKNQQRMTQGDPIKITLSEAEGDEAPDVLEVPNPAHNPLEKKMSMGLVSIGFKVKVSGGGVCTGLLLNPAVTIIYQEKIKSGALAVEAAKPVAKVNTATIPDMSEEEDSDDDAPAPPTKKAKVETAPTSFEADLQQIAQMT